MRVYLDHNAATPLREEARARWLEIHDELVANPSSPHASGRRARHLVDEARERIAGALGVGEDELVFTSGGTEANNLALFGRLQATGGRPAGAGLVTTGAEHSSILAVADELAARGHPVDRVGVDAECLPDPPSLLAAARDPSRALVSVAAANAEVGALAPLGEIAEGLRALEPRPSFHTDAVQALGRIPMDLAGWGCDLASLSVHKVGGPRGIGVLWVRAGTPLAPLLRGGGQEQGLRPGTEDVASIAAGAVAIELAVREQKAYHERVHSLSSSLWRELVTTLPEARLLGPAIDSPRRLPNTLCVHLPSTIERMLVTRLDLEGLEVSAGSACTSGSVEPSHVLCAMGLDDEVARAALRLSLGRTTTARDCHHAVDILLKVGASSHAT